MGLQSSSKAQKNSAQSVGGASTRTEMVSDGIEIQRNSGILMVQMSFNLIFVLLSSSLVGIVVGPFMLSRINKVKEFLLQASSAKYYKFFSLMCRILFMFSIGLETDIAYLWRNLSFSQTSNSDSTLQTPNLVPELVSSSSLSEVLFDDTVFSNHHSELE